jgi:hypothetical protein
VGEIFVTRSCQTPATLPEVDSIEFRLTDRVFSSCFPQGQTGFSQSRHGDRGKTPLIVSDFLNANP